MTERVPEHPRLHNRGLDPLYRLRFLNKSIFFLNFYLSMSGQNFGVFWSETTYL